LSNLFRYGDRYPRSNQGRIFTIVWFIVGYVVICVFVATLASSLSVKIVVITNNPSQGGKVLMIVKLWDTCGVNGNEAVVFCGMNNSKVMGYLWYEW
jgi:hypothetical protein